MPQLTIYVLQSTGGLDDDVVRDSFGDLLLAWILDYRRLR